VIVKIVYAFQFDNLHLETLAFHLVFKGFFNASADNIEFAVRFKAVAPHSELLLLLVNAWRNKHEQRGGEEGSAKKLP
jgi:hypothetical protein